MFITFSIASIMHSMNSHANSENLQTTKIRHTLKDIIVALIELNSMLQK